MLEGIRKKRNSVLILFAFAAIIIVFIFWGVGPNKGSKEQDQGVVATVDGEPIPFKEYANLYKRQIDYYKNTFKGEFNEEMVRKLNLKRKAVEILINRSVAIKAAQAEGFKVSEKEVQDAVKAIPAFSKSGVFDKDLYFQVLSTNRIKPAEFEKNVELDLLTMKMRDKVLKDLTVTDEEIKQEYLKENRKIDLSYIAVEGANLKDTVSASDDEAKEYFKKNSSDFMIPVRVKAVYAYAGTADASRKYKPAEDEARSYYEKNLKDFETPEEAKASHILIRPDDKAGDKVKARQEARQKAEEILARIKKGEKFADLAKNYSQDPGSAKQGGQLGWFPKGVMVKAFEDAVFSLKKGEVSGLVETEFGYHIITVEDKKDSGVIPFKKAEDSIKRTIIRDKAKAQAKEAITAVAKSFKEAKSADEVKKGASGDVRVVTTDFFSQNDKVVLAENDALKGTVFSLKAGEASDIIETGDGFYVVKVLERTESRVPEYAEAASRVKEKIIERKANEAAMKKADELLKRAKGGEGLASIAKAEKLKVESTGYFSRVDGFMPKIGAFAADNDKLFDLTTAAPYYFEVFPNENKYYIFKLNGVKEAEESGLGARREEIKARLLAQKQEQALTKWLDGLKAKAKIKVFDNML